MKSVRAVLDYLSQGGVQYLFGIPAGSVNALFDELYEIPHITPIITKHEGAASYMAAAYAKYTQHLGVCIGCSGPGSTNLLSGAAHAMREHLPILFLTGAVPVRTMGLNASQELSAVPLFQPVTKYSASVNKSEDLLQEVKKAVDIAFSNIPGPVHIEMPIDIQLSEIEPQEIPSFPLRQPLSAPTTTIETLAQALTKHELGIIFIGQGAKQAIAEAIHLAELLNWPILTTPQAKGFVPDSHPLHYGVFGFAGHESATKIIHNPNATALVIIGSSLGETATSNWNPQLTKDRFVVQIDMDSSVFQRKYEINFPVHASAEETLKALCDQLNQLGLVKKDNFSSVHEPAMSPEPWEYNTQTLLQALQDYLPDHTRYTVDIGEFMSYVIHYMAVKEVDSFEINVHFGPMGYGISSAIGMYLADSSRPIVSITGDGCFFMHGMEILTAKEYQLPILFVVMNNARLGMVYHGHNLQYQRSHPRFEQSPIHISNLAKELGIPSYRIDRLEDLKEEEITRLISLDGPAVLEVALVDNNTPPMGDRVKFLSSFQK